MLVFFENGQGFWAQADRHREEKRIHFQWKSVGSNLTITTSDGTKRTVRYELVTENGNQALRFDEALLPESYREFH